MQDPNAPAQIAPMPDAKPAWKILRIDEEKSFNNQGAVTMETATVQLADGSTFTVSVPRQTGWSDAIQKAADDHAAELYNALGAQSDTYITP